MMTPLVYPGSEGLEKNRATLPGSKPMLRPQSVIKADSLDYFIWDVKDLDTQKSFLLDFGMLPVEQNAHQMYMRGYGSAPYIYIGKKAQKTAFVGMGFSVSHFEQLECLSDACDVPIEPLYRPGGGQVVRLTDPQGHIVEVCHGVQQVEPVPARNAPLPANTPQQKVRINTGQRPELMPSPVMNAGHCVLGANNFEEMAQWYMHYLGMLPTDVMCLPDSSHAIAFMRLDRGDQPADHHTVVFTKGTSCGYQHSAFEVVDLDALAQGQQYLKMKKRKHVWGLGRHILGSQIFDYWDDPSGFEFEHYADGDVFTADYPTEYHPLDIGNIYAWGADMPASYTGISLRQIRDTLRDLWRGKLTLSWIKMASTVLKRPARPWL